MGLLFGRRPENTEKFLKTTEENNKTNHYVINIML